MDSNNGKQRFDEDILRCKAEILRLKGLVPPFGQPQKNSDNSIDDKSQSPETVIEVAPSPVQETSPETAIISLPVDNNAKPAETDNEPSAELSVISDSDQLYDELQKPVPDGKIETSDEAALPEMDADWPYEKAEDAESTEEKVIAETSDNHQEQAPALIDEAGSLSESTEDLEVPAFDLAQQIMAEQRKIIGNRRKRPGNPQFEIREEKQPTPQTSPVFTTATAVHKHRSASTPINRDAPQTAAPMSPQQRVIAEIVARDINKFYPSHPRPRCA